MEQNEVPKPHMQTYQQLTEKQVAWAELRNIEEYKIRTVWKIYCS